MDQVIAEAVSERQAALTAYAFNPNGIDVSSLVTVDEAVMRLEDALMDDDEAPEQVDPERVGLRRALNLPDVPAVLSGRR